MSGGAFGQSWKTHINSLKMKMAQPADMKAQKNRHESEENGESDTKAGRRGRTRGGAGRGLRTRTTRTTTTRTRTMKGSEACRTKWQSWKRISFCWR